MTAKPPRIARALLAAATPPTDRLWLLGDLDEMYAAECARHGPIHAGIWYHAQVVRSIPPLLWRRLQSAPAMTTPLETSPPERIGSALYLLRHAVRRLLREPGFTLAAVLTLALGIGGSVAVFAAVEAVLLRPLPYPDADRLVTINHRDTRTGLTKEYVAVGDAVDLSIRQTVFDAIGAYGYGDQRTVTDADEPYRVSAISASPPVLQALGFKPLLGRSFETTDVGEGVPTVVILGYTLWQTRFSGDRAVIGRSIRLGQTPRTIVGVAPRGFRFRGLEPPEIITPDGIPTVAPVDRKNGWTFLLGRLRAGRTLADADADLTRISGQMAEESPKQNTGSLYFATPLREVLVGGTRTPLLLLLGAVLLVMLIACANVANLLLARSLSRRREMAVRMALGAGRARLALQLLSESFVLAVTAGGAGVLFSYWGARALVTLMPESVQVPGLTEVRLNAPVLGFALVITLVTTLVFSLVAMITVRRDSAASVLVGAGRTSAGGTMRRMAAGLVVVEVALAIILLLGAGLITRTFAGLLSVDPGFRYDRVMTLSTSLPGGDRYKEPAALELFYRNAFAALRAVPGVQEVGTAAVTPLTGNNWTVPLDRADKPVPAAERPPEVGWQVATGGYFKALGIPLKAGRLFDERDGTNAPMVVIVSEATAVRYFPNENPIGHLLVGAGPHGREQREIVGVVGNIRRAGLRDDPRADLYFPAEHEPQPMTTFFIRTAGDPVALTPSLHAALRSVEPRIVLTESRSLGEVAAESVRTTRLVLSLLGVFAIAALVLAAIGVYGVMSYVVRQRTREIGTRMALGATQGAIIRMIMREGAVIAGLGTALGLGIGLVGSRALSAILYNVSPSDPVSVGGATVILAGAILAACYIPARRAAKVAPAETLTEA